jgi:hypothetical protein
VYNSYFYCSSITQISAAFFRLRHGRFPPPEETHALAPPTPHALPTSLSLPQSLLSAGYTTVNVEDHYPSKMIIFKISGSTSGATAMSSESRPPPMTLIFRASGTEPKFKFYCQRGPLVVSTCGEGPFDAVKDKLDRDLQSAVHDICRAWIQPDSLGVQPSRGMKENGFH